MLAIKVLCALRVNGSLFLKNFLEKFYFVITNVYLVSLIYNEAPRDLSEKVFASFCFHLIYLYNSPIMYIFSLDCVYHYCFQHVQIILKTITFLLSLILALGRYFKCVIWTKCYCGIHTITYLILFSSIMFIHLRLHSFLPPLRIFTVVS